MISLFSKIPSRLFVRAALVVLAIAPCPANSASRAAPQYVLALSWQPAFCETRPDRPECVSQTRERFDAANFSLHGLWPQPRRKAYCKVDPDQIALDKAGKWKELKPIALEPATRAELDRVMPGTQSGLELHEWLRHGTCYHNASAQQYFADSLALMRALNASSVRALFAANIGKEITANAIQLAFDEAFGADAGKRIRILCKRDGSRRIITEITLGLTGELRDESGLAQLIAAAPPTSTGCPGGIVDAPGFQ